MFNLSAFNIGILTIYFSVRLFSMPQSEYLMNNVRVDEVVLGL
jgi:hypothetical protein